MSLISHPAKQYPPVPVSPQRLIFCSASGLLLSSPHKGGYTHPPYFLLALSVEFVLPPSSFLKVSCSPAYISLCAFLQHPFLIFTVWELRYLRGRQRRDRIKVLKDVSGCPPLHCLAIKQLQNSPI